MRKRTVIHIGTQEVQCRKEILLTIICRFLYIESAHFLHHSSQRYPKRHRRFGLIPARKPERLEDELGLEVIDFCLAVSSARAEVSG